MVSSNNTVGYDGFEHTFMDILDLDVLVKKNILEVIISLLWLKNLGKILWNDLDWKINVSIFKTKKIGIVIKNREILAQIFWEKLRRIISEI